ncbi:hypothetical protein GQ600_3346 [Phytophthora cactorum]|nr:hypothetical protein GQ600_3346 [Phytophthora cactorum]
MPADDVTLKRRAAAGSTSSSGLHSVESELELVLVVELVRDGSSRSYPYFCSVAMSSLALAASFSSIVLVCVSVCWLSYVFVAAGLNVSQLAPIAD